MSCGHVAGHQVVDTSAGVASWSDVQRFCAANEGTTAGHRLGVPYRPWERYRSAVFVKEVASVWVPVQNTSRLARWPGGIAVLLLGTRAKAEGVPKGCRAPFSPTDLISRDAARAVRQSGNEVRSRYAKLHGFPCLSEGACRPGMPSGMPIILLGPIPQMSDISQSLANKDALPAFPWRMG